VGTRQRGESSWAKQKEHFLLPALLYKGTSEKVGEIYKFGLYPVFQQSNIIHKRSILTPVKDPQKNENMEVVYKIPCKDCNKVHIRETGRSLRTMICKTLAGRGLERY
jgi:hypothetical protein